MFVFTILVTADRDVAQSQIIYLPDKWIWTWSLTNVKQSAKLEPPDLRAALNHYHQKCICQLW